MNPRSERCRNDKDTVRHRFTSHSMDKRYYASFVDYQALGGRCAISPPVGERCLVLNGPRRA